MDAKLTNAIGAALGSEVAHQRGLAGGDINDAYHVVLRDGREVFVKSNRRLPGAVFQVEARGLQWLRVASERQPEEALRVPEVLAVSKEEAEPAFLVLEYLQSGPRFCDFDERLGRGLAALHGAHPKSFGLDHDNFIGSLPQDNRPGDDWAVFWRERRLEPQLRRAVDAGKLSAATRRDFERLLQRIGQLVGDPEPPARLHGDLWGGNLHTGPSGEPCLIDPACYGGHREVDLAMMRLFGGFSQRVFDAYDDAWPLAAGYQERIPLYQLYPLLVHVNLFGGGYAASVQAALRSLV